jgi:hypothetical protein
LKPTKTGKLKGVYNMNNRIVFPSGLYYVPEKEVPGTLFYPGGTAAGTWKQVRGGILFSTLDQGPEFFLVDRPQEGNFFVSCRRYEKGKIFYNFALSSRTEKKLGLYGYLQKIRLAEEIARETRKWRQ